MKQSGWTRGCGIGRDLAGVSEPIEVEGQSPYCKKGLGLDCGLVLYKCFIVCKSCRYRGEKLDRTGHGTRKKQKLTKDVLISTVYDQPVEHLDTELQSAPSTSLKYRQKPGGISRI